MNNYAVQGAVAFAGCVASGAVAFAAGGNGYNAAAFVLMLAMVFGFSAAAAHIKE